MKKIVKQPTLSIIVPVYNAEKYIDQCIESVLTQSFTDFELILVNDGSTDSSLERCYAWDSDERVKVFFTENRGVSHARNYGLKNAIGKWILFLDSDDYLVKDSLEALISYTVHDVEEIAGLFADEVGESNQFQSEIVEAKDMITMSLDSVNNHLLPDFYELKEETLPGCWGKLYLRKVIEEKGLKFHEDLRLSEDLVFHLEYLSVIEKVLVTNVPVFIYRKNPSSVTKNFKLSHYNDRMNLIGKLSRFPEESVNVHIVMTMLLFACKIEKSVNHNDKKEMEQRIGGFFAENRRMLWKIVCKRLSRGKWQRIFYKIVVCCFLMKMNWLAFKILKIYTRIARGEI